MRTAPVAQQDQPAGTELQNKMQEFYRGFRGHYPCGFEGSFRRLAGQIAPRLGFDPLEVLRRMEEDGVLIERPGARGSRARTHVQMAPAT